MSKVNLQALDKIEEMPTKAKVSPWWVNSPRVRWERREPEYWVKYRAVKRAGINKPWDETVEKLKKILPKQHHNMIYEDRIQLDSDGIPRLVNDYGDYIGSVPEGDMKSTCRHDWTFIDLDGILRRVFYQRFHFTPKNIKSLRQHTRKLAARAKACKENADYYFRIDKTILDDKKNNRRTTLFDKIRLQVDGATTPVKTFNPNNGIWEYKGATTPQYTHFTVKEFIYFCTVRKQTYALEVDGKFITNVKIC